MFSQSSPWELQIQLWKTSSIKSLISWTQGPLPFQFHFRWTSLTSALKVLKAAKPVCVCEETGLSYLETEPSMFPEMEIGPNILFVRRCYAKLFEHLRARQKAVLLGNPGISKSKFHAYMLYRYLQSDITPLPPNHLESIAPPQVIIRQIGYSEMQLMFLEDCLAFTTYPAHPVISPFSPATTEYLYEPGPNVRCEPFYSGLTLSTKATCAPDESQYKEFCKNGGEKF